jgi:predicted methyltransferase
MNILERSACARLACAALVIALAACGHSKQEAASPPVNEASSPPAAHADTAAIQAVLSKPDRFAGDAEQDAWRKPVAVIEFLNVQPGAKVIDYFAAAGYYTELLAPLVGPQGKVIAYNNAPYLKYAADTPAKRYAGERLPNVTQLTAPPEQVALDPNSIDAVLFVDAYHDLYWRPKDDSWQPVDPKAALAQLVPAIKPGGTVVVVDHVAAAGGDTIRVVDSLHRIDPEIVKRDFTAAGLSFEDESPALRNPQDDHTKPVFDPAIRHQTDQFVYRFKKPLP